MVIYYVLPQYKINYKTLFLHKLILQDTTFTNYHKQVLILSQCKLYQMIYGHQFKVVKIISKRLNNLTHKSFIQDLV